MSPALLDSRAPAHTLYVHHEGHPLQNPNPYGQVSSLSSLNFSGFSSFNPSMTMNSSNANTEPSGFQNSKEITSDIGFNKPGLGSGKPAFGSDLGRSKPRMVKLRRHAASSNPRSTLSPETGNVDPGFNPFRTISDNSIPSFSGAEKGSSVSGNMNFGNVRNEAFVFGTSGEKSSTYLNSRIGNSSGFVANQILDDIRKLKIGNEQEFVTTSNPGLNVNMSDKESSLHMSDIEGSSGAEDSDKGVLVFGSVHKKSAESKLPDGMRKLNIEGSVKAERPKNVKYVNSNLSAHNNTHFSFGSADNVAKSFGTSVALELPNALKKLNIKDAGEVDGGSISFNADDMKKFVFGDLNKDSNSLAGSSASTLPDKMKNLNMKDSVNTYGGEKKEVNSASDKSGFVFGSTEGASGSLDGRAETMLLDEMGKLKIAKEGGDNTGQRPSSFGSSTLFMKETLGNLGDKKFQDVRSSIPAEFAFQEGLQGHCFSGSEVTHDHCNDYSKLHGTTASSSTFSSRDVRFQPVGNVIEVPSMDRPEKKDEFNLTSSWDGMGTPHVKFSAPNQKGNIYTGLDTKPEFSAKRESAKDARSKKRRGKLRKPTPVQQWFGQDLVSRKSISQEQPDSFESYSPMDVSPYEEILDHNKGSTETSVASEEAFRLSINKVSSGSCSTVSNDAIDEDLVVATQRLDINEGDVKCAETEVEDSRYGFGKGVGTEDHSEESVLGPQTESFKSADEQLDYSTDTFVTAADTEVSSSPRIERQDCDGRMQFSFASASEDVGGTSFMFAASSSAQSQSPAAIRHYKKKNHVKVVHDSYSSTPNTKAPHTSSPMQFFPLSETSSLLSPRRGQRGDLPTSFSKRGDKSDAVKEQETKQETISTPAASIAVQAACEKWRLRGNQAYANGDMSRAEEYYTRGVNCVSQNESSRSCLRALMLCYSNRAATRISLGRMREAILDCMKAAAIDPNFLRVQVRAANCYLALGEVEDASLHFIKCLQSGSDACVDRKLVLEASEGLEKAQKVSECMKQSAELLQRRTSSDAQSALGVIAEALTISSYCEKLLEMKADALFMLRKYEELIQLCEQTLGSAEMNCSAISADGHLTNLDCSVFRIETSVRLWRLRLIIKSYFCLGRLEEALDFLKKQEESVSTTEESESKTLESLIPLASTIRELVRHKAAGNEAFQSGRHAEAVEHYTAALSCTVESRPFAAVCFCNRAAAYKAMGQIIDAIADCSLAIALDRNYMKAISRRATLFELIRDYEQATRDLQRLVSFLMKQVEDKANQSGASDRTSCVNELRQAQQRLSSIEQEARKEIPLNKYLILGVDPSVMASEIKKAYRKAALRHHPDKAGQSLARSENRDDGLPKEVVEEVHKDADRIFKMIGEAYAVLSDPNKRSRYDLEEEMQNTQKRGTGGTSRTHRDDQNYPFERSSSRRQWREVWRSYGNSQSRGSEATRSSRYYDKQGL